MGIKYVQYYKHIRSKACYTNIAVGLTNTFTLNKFFNQTKVKYTEILRQNICCFCNIYCKLSYSYYLIALVCSPKQT